MPVSTLPAGLVNRNGHYYLRIVIPKELRHLYPSSGKLPKERIWVSLNTTDLRAAKIAMKPVGARYDRIFKAQLEGLPARVALTEDDLHEAALGAYNERIALDKWLRMGVVTDADRAAMWAFLRRAHDEEEAHGVMLEAEREIADHATVRAELNAAMRAEAGRFGESTVREDVENFIREKHLDAEPGTVARKKIASAIQRGMIEAFRRGDELDGGDFTGAVKDPLVSAPRTPRAKPGEGILDVFDKFEKHNPENCNANTLAQSKYAFRLFASTLPDRATVDAITKATVRDWVDLCREYPRRASDTKVFKGLKCMEDVIEANRNLEEDAKPLVAAKTINRWLSAVGAFCKWAINQGHLDREVNPCHGLYLNVEDRPPETFTPEQLQTIFTSEMFVEGVTRDLWFWTSLVQLFTGMRQGEVAQLLVKDVFEQHGRHTIFVTKRGGGGKSLKTASSERVVVVHPELVRLGFIRHVEEMTSAGAERLFPAAEKNSRGQWIADYSREFSRHLARIGVKEGPGLSSHSFRHTAIDAMRGGGYLNEEIAPIVGHAKTKLQTSGYGKVAEDRVRRDAPVIDSISYEALDLSHLRVC